MSDILKVMGGIAGIGGLALAVFLLLYRGVLYKWAPPTSKLTGDHAYKIVRLFLVLTFCIATLGLVAYLFGLILESSSKVNALRKETETLRDQLIQTEQRLAEFTEAIEVSRYPNIAEPRSEVTLDLSGWCPVPANRRDEPISAAIWKTRCTVVRISDDVKRYADAYSTRGPTPVISCATHKFTVTRDTDRNRVGAENLNRWLIDIDISDAPVQEPFEIEHSAKMWNSFAGELEEWAAVPCHYPGESLTWTIIFPAGKPLKEYQLLAYSKTPGQPRDTFTGERRIEVAQDRRRLCWRIPNPRIGYIYRVNWSW